MVFHDDSSSGSRKRRRRRRRTHSRDDTFQNRFAASAASAALSVSTKNRGTLSTGGAVSQSDSAGKQKAGNKKRIFLI